eukprot:TRINITY_DN886_c0_g1_i14.p1 TRINITY_DN886_c0_g1~~TRINITY_DN886_c0_g1_i14.p1  ORF type:complete len:139 (+),score=22.71 TRINITY_DN886_c0_g1_i14:1943-2359(+)
MPAVLLSHRHPRISPSSQVEAAFGGCVTGVCSACNADFKHCLGAVVKSGYLIRALRQRVTQHGSVGDLLDCVSSGDACDAAFGYEEARTSTGAIPSCCTATRVSPRLATRPGSATAAGFKRVLGVTLFGKVRELFWVQ